MEDPREWQQRQGTLGAGMSSDARVKTKLTSDSEHLEPVSFLNDTNKYDKADDNKGKDGELLGEIIHIEL